MFETYARVGAAALLLYAFGACGDDDDQNTSTGEAGHGSAGSGSKDAGGMRDAGVIIDAGNRDAFDPQLPPASSDQVERWLAERYFDDWTCEPEPTAKTDGAKAIHVHGGKSRVCSNALLAKSSRSAGGELPKGVASVKEVFDDGGKLTLTAVSVKIAAQSSEGQGWYWWEGAANNGVGAKVCVGCHAASGSDDDHPGAGDYVYFKN
jgi:hypothetical protein